jgi:hypothetical protein
MSESERERILKLLLIQHVALCNPRTTVMKIGLLDKALHADELARKYLHKIDPNWGDTAIELTTERP